MKNSHKNKRNREIPTKFDSEEKLYRKKKIESFNRSKIKSSISIFKLPISIYFLITFYRIFNFAAYLIPRIVDESIGQCQF